MSNNIEASDGHIILPEKENSFFDDFTTPDIQINDYSNDIIDINPGSSYTDGIIIDDPFGDYMGTKLIENPKKPDSKPEQRTNSFKPPRPDRSKPSNNSFNHSSNHSSKPKTEVFTKPQDEIDRIENRNKAVLDKQDSRVSQGSSGSSISDSSSKNMDFSTLFNPEKTKAVDPDNDNNSVITDHTNSSELLPSSWEVKKEVKNDYKEPVNDQRNDQRNPKVIDVNPPRVRDRNERGRDNDRNRDRDRNESYPDPDPGPDYYDQRPNNVYTGYSLPTFDSESKEKVFYLVELKNLIDTGVKLTLTRDLFKCSLEELRVEYQVQKTFQLKKSVLQTAKQFLITFTYVIEVVSKSANEHIGKNYPSVPDKLKLDLEGWSESVASSIGMYEPVLERLYDKYMASTGDIPPELHLVGLLIFSAISFSTSKKILNEVPNIMGMINNNPGFLQNIFNAFMPKPQQPTYQTQPSPYSQSQQQSQQPQYEPQYQQPVNVPQQQPQQMQPPTFDIQSLMNSMGLLQQQQPQFSDTSLDTSSKDFGSAINSFGPPVATREMYEPPLGNLFRDKIVKDQTKNITRALSKHDDEVSVGSAGSETKSVTLGSVKKPRKGGKSGLIINLG